jgi:hypothetical protein
MPTDQNAQANGHEHYGVAHDGNLIINESRRTMSAMQDLMNKNDLVGILCSCLQMEQLRSSSREIPYFSR